MPTQRTTKLARERRRFELALRPFLTQHDSPVEVRVWPGPIKSAIICVKPSLFRQWDFDGWLKRGVLIASFDSVHPVAGLRPVLAAIAAVTKRVVFIGDLDPVDLAMFAMIQSVLPAGVNLAFGGMDDGWLLKEKASRTTQDATPYMGMSRAELRLWRALRAAYPAIDRLIGPQSKAVLDRGNKIEVEGACALDWHRHAMCRYAFQRAFGAHSRHS